MRGYREGKGRDAGDIKNADEKEEELSLRGIESEEGKEERHKLCFKTYEWPVGSRHETTVESLFFPIVLILGVKQTVY